MRLQMCSTESLQRLSVLMWRLVFCIVAGVAFVPALCAQTSAPDPAQIKILAPFHRTAAALPSPGKELLLLWGQVELFLAEQKDSSGIALQLFLTPPLDPWGEPWKVALERVEEAAVSPPILESTLADPSGGWTSRRWPPASYRVQVLDHSDNVHYSQLHELSPSAGPVSIQLEMVAVEGKVAMGSGPWEGNLVFGGQEAVRVTVSTDDKGRFSVILPRQGRWPLIAEFSDGSDLELDPVEIFQSEKGPAYLALDLPDLKIEGDVYLDGEKLAEATVMMRDPERPAQGRLSGTLSDADGHFVLRGRRAMEVVVTAVHPESKAEWLTARLAPDSPPMRLDLARFGKLRGRVLGPSGLPLPGARVEVRSGASAVMPWTDRGNTSGEGTFELRLAPDPGPVEVLVYIPGFALYWRELPEVGSLARPLEIRLVPETGLLELQWVSKDLLDSLRLEGPARGAPLKRWLEIAVPFGLFSTTPSGALRLAGLGTGPYSLCLAQTCDIGILPSGEQLTLSAAKVTP